MVLNVLIKMKNRIYAAPAVKGLTYPDTYTIACYNDENITCIYIKHNYASSADFQKIHL